MNRDPRDRQFWTVLGALVLSAAFWGLLYVVVAELHP